MCVLCVPFCTVMAKRDRESRERKGGEREREGDRETARGKVEREGRERERASEQNIRLASLLV